MATLRVSNLRGRSNGESPSLPDGAVVTGVCTATSFTGDLTGNATGLSGTPNLNVGIVTATTIEATTYVGVPEGTNVLKAMLFV